MQMSSESALHKKEYAVRRRGPSGDISSNLTLTITQDIDSRLRIVLSDPLDPSFLCVLIITQSDFEEIKKTQGLLVDFDNFPAQFIRLLQQCESGNMFLYLHQQGPSSIFVEIIERNDFKRLVHLSLKTGPASDAEIKRNMADNILQLQKRLENVTSVLNSKETTFQEKEKFLEARISDLNSTLSNINKDNLQKEREFHETLSRERDRLDQDKQEWQRNFEIRSKNHIQTLQDVLTRKEKQLEDASLRCRQFQDTLKSLESQINDKSQRIFTLEKQMQMTTSDVEALQNQNEMLEKNLKDKDNNLQNIKSKLKDTQKALKEKSEMLRDALDTMQNLKLDMGNLEEKSHQKETLFSKQQMELQNSNADLFKANDTILSQNKIIFELKEKVKIRTAIVLEQEKVIEKNAKEINELTEKETKSQEEIEINKKTIDELIKQLDSNKIIMEEKTKTITKNNSVIQWLQAKLDAAQSVKESAISLNTGLSTTSNFFTPFSHDPTEAQHSSQDKLSDLYSAEFQSNKTARTSSISAKQSEEEFGLDPVYLQPSSYSNRFSNRKSQDTLFESASSVESRPNQKNKENKKNTTIKSKKVKSTQSSYFPNY